MTAPREKAIIRYVRRVTDAAGCVDGSLDTNALYFDARVYTARIAGITMSGRIPNVFDVTHNGKTYCTSKCLVTCAGKDPLSISLPTAYMSAEEIGEYIGNQFNDVWINVHDPGIVIQFNHMTGHTMVTLDSTKINAGIITSSISIDFGVSQLGELLGFVGDKSKVAVDPRAKVTVTSPEPARINWLGDTFDVTITGLSTIHDFGCPVNMFGVITTTTNKWSDSVERKYTFTRAITDRMCSQLTFQFMSHAQPTLPLLLMARGRICVDLVLDG